MKAQALAAIDTLGAAALPTLVFALIFLGCIAIAWAPSRAEHQRSMARLPLSDEEV